MHFEHAGIATENARELAELYTDLFGIQNVHEEEFDGMRIIFLDCGNGYFELLEPFEDGTIAQYLERNGPGIHHLALRTDDIEGALETAREHDVRLIDEEPRPGAWGHTVAFLHPSDTGGILLELVEH
ncbi:methylmalonyl-CoA epimerase [Natrialba chahannaoensis JCM 10990]|uniref:Methylmalonyl-CoA epimerase n=1 Tax=Natrialba chahannaoensis JCM 10990 TaxID=1227492 RepID=M0AQT9_9EURY|nr:methylmalonyl-CoA epimerase [Natrialba chahannaoensis]ELZ01061.1 methylmalonyl-CoA epimerase [Natrialba chahannaoensis JCM 10990]